MFAKGFAPLFLALCGLLLDTAPAAAQGKLELRIGVSPDTAKASATFSSLPMRPNQSATFYLFVHNKSTTEVAKPTLTVTAEGVVETDPPPPPAGAAPPAPPAPGAPKEVVLKLGEKLTLPDVQPNKTELIRFKLEKEWCLTTSSELKLKLTDDRTSDSDSETIKFTTMKPQDYLTFSPSLSSKGQLGITVSTKENLDPPCRLVLDCSRVTSWEPDQEAVLVNELHGKDKQAAMLTVQELRKPPAGRGYGLIKVNADGTRAKVYVVKTDAGLVLTELESPNALRIEQRPAAAPKDPKAKAKVIDLDIEVDNPDDNTRLRLSVDLTGEGGYETRRVFPTARKNQHCLRTAPDGGLAVRSLAGDWDYQLNTEGLQGRVVLRADLLDSADKVLETRTHPIYVSTRPPTITAFTIEKPKATYAPGEDVRLVARAQDETGIAKVSFFLGDAPPAQPKKDLTVTEMTAGAYAAPLTLPEQKGKVTLGVIVENKEGLKSVATFDVRLVEPPSEAEMRNKPGSLKGKVVQGVTQIPQAGLTIELYSTKPNVGVVKSVTTGDDGAFEIKGIPPGDYVVSCVRAIDKTRARAAVTIPPGTVVELKDPLSLKR